MKPRARRRLRARVAELLWRLAGVDTFEQLAALEGPVARAQAAACGDPPACQALSLAYEQTSWRLVNRLCGGLLEALARIFGQVARAAESILRSFARLVAEVVRV